MSQWGCQYYSVRMDETVTATAATCSQTEVYAMVAGRGMMHGAVRESRLERSWSVLNLDDTFRALVVSKLTDCWEIECNGA